MRCDFPVLQRQKDRASNQNAAHCLGKKVLNCHSVPDGGQPRMLPDREADGHYRIAEGTANITRRGKLLYGPLNILCLSHAFLQSLVSR